LQKNNMISFNQQILKEFYEQDAVIILKDDLDKILVIKSYLEKEDPEYYKACWKYFNNIEEFTKEYY